MPGGVGDCRRKKKKGCFTHRRGKERPQNGKTLEGGRVIPQQTKKGGLNEKQFQAGMTYSTGLYLFLEKGTKAKEERSAIFWSPQLFSTFSRRKKGRGNHEITRGRKREKNTSSNPLSPKFIPPMQRGSRLRRAGAKKVSLETCSTKSVSLC